MADKKCSNCTTDKPTNKEEKVVFSSASYERHEARHERREKRLVWIIALLILLLVGSNAGWLIYESQFETVETTNEEYQIEQEAENGNNNSIINGGEIVNGETNN
jgi:hypothetical protein